MSSTHEHQEVRHYSDGDSIAVTDWPGTREQCWTCTPIQQTDFGYYADDLGFPEFTDTGVRCGNHGREKVHHQNCDAVRACFAVARDLAAQQAAEIYAEAGMSWVAGGGSPEDARIYASVVASGRSWDAYVTGR